MTPKTVMNRVRLSRRLETKRNLEVMWLSATLSPNHKTIANFRHENGAALKRVFRDFVGVCVKLGLWGKELVGIDGSTFKAVNSVEELERSGETQKSLMESDSRLMAANGKREVRYNVRMAVDAKNKLIEEFEVTNERTDNNQITPMVERTKTILGTEALTVVADAGYDSVQDIVGSMAHGATPHIAGMVASAFLPRSPRRPFL